MQSVQLAQSAEVPSSFPGGAEGWYYWCISTLLSSCPPPVSWTFPSITTAKTKALLTSRRHEQKQPVISFWCASLIDCYLKTFAPLAEMHEPGSPGTLWEAGERTAASGGSWPQPQLQESVRGSSLSACLGTFFKWDIWDQQLSMTMSQEGPVRRKKKLASSVYAEGSEYGDIL